MNRQKEDWLRDGEKYGLNGLKSMRDRLGEDSPAELGQAILEMQRNQDDSRYSAQVNREAETLKVAKQARLIALGALTVSILVVSFKN